MKKNLLLLMLAFSSLTGAAQVKMKDKIIMTGTAAPEKAVSGSSAPASSTDAVNASTLQSGRLVFSVASGTNALSAALSPPLPAYSEGSAFNIKVPTMNTGPVTLNINGLGNVPVIKPGGDALDSADIGAGDIISVIYNGNSFQLLSPIRKKCPGGFVKVSDDFCIEVNERDSASYWQAVNTCFNSSYRLCTVGEWSAACQNNAAVIDMINNHEWVDSAANTPSAGITVKTLGMDYLNAPGCDKGYYGLPSAIRKYRCCYSLK